jgi:hypothetical protein
VLGKKVTIKAELYLWQVIALLWMTLLIFYVFWEMYWYTKVGVAVLKWHTFVVPALSIGATFLLPFKITRFLCKNLLAGYCYFVLSICVWQEFHPFSRMPMYDTFTSYNFSFKVTDKSNRLIATHYNLNMHSGALAHLFSTICRRQGISFTPEQISNRRLQLIGNEMMQKIKLKASNTINTDTIQLYIVCDYYSGNSIKTTEQLLASKALAEIGNDR